MDSDNYKVMYCPEDDENRVNCNICDKLCTEKFFKNHLKSQTLTNIIKKISKKVITNKYGVLL